MTAVGIDAGKTSLDVATEGRPGILRIANHAAGLRKLVRQLDGLLEARTVVEATGGEEPLLEACRDAGLWVARVNPRQARNFARAAGDAAKTDAIDARLLCLMARMFADGLQRYRAPLPWQRELRDWLRRRGQVVTALQAHRQQMALCPRADPRVGGENDQRNRNPVAEVRLAAIGAGDAASERRVAADGGVAVSSRSPAAVTSSHSSGANPRPGSTRTGQPRSRAAARAHAISVGLGRTCVLNQTPRTA